MFSFATRKKVVDMQPFVRRICDLTAPNNATAAGLPRSENRYNRVIPTLLCPWEEHRPIIDRTVVALTRDMSDRGVGVTLTHPLQADELVVGFYLAGVMQEPWFFRGLPSRCDAMGGGFWLLGIELVEYMNEQWRDELDPLFGRAQKLLPPVTAPDEVLQTC
jgi:hypothetical protein